MTERRRNPFRKEKGKEAIPVVSDPKTGMLVGYRGSIPGKRNDKVEVPKRGRPKGSIKKVTAKSAKRRLLNEMIQKRRERLREEKSRPPTTKRSYPSQVVVQLPHETRSILLAEVEKRTLALGVRVYIADVARDYLEKGMQEDYPGHKVEGEVRSYQKPQPPPDPYARFSVRQTQRLKVLGITPPPEEEEED
jgi:hypothetical protein